MRQKALEIELEKVPPHPNPSAELEQYGTPARVAAQILYTAFGMGDIQGRKVLDLGCGTGIFAIGSAMLGAREVVGIDVDEASVRIAHRLARERGLDVDFMVMDVSDLEEEGDTTVMNPPFGCQTPHADMPFLRKAISLCPTVYSLHSVESEAFVRRTAKGLNGVISFENRFTYDIKHTFDFHKKERMSFEATLFRIVRDEEVVQG